MKTTSKLFNIKYENGSNEIVLFPKYSDLKEWLEIMYQLGNRKRASVKEIIEVN